MSSKKRFDIILGKQRARARWREFLRQNIFDRRNGHVLCLPGAYGREIEDVYRKLGFRDENIVGVEASADIAPDVRSHYPKIELHTGDVRDVCRDYPGPPFSVVSLDYCGHVSLQRFEPLQVLSARGCLRTPFAVMVNFFVGRELNLGQLRQQVHGLLEARQATRFPDGSDFYTDPQPGAPWDFLDITPFGDVRMPEVWREWAHRYQERQRTWSAKMLEEHERESEERLARDPFGVAEYNKLRAALIGIGLSQLESPATDIACAALQAFTYINDTGQRMASAFAVYRCIDGHMERRQGYCSEEDLGGGALPIDHGRIRERALSMLRKGRTNEEIQSRLPITVGSIRALRAQLTKELARARV